MGVIGLRDPSPSSSVLPWFILTLLTVTTLVILLTSSFSLFAFIHPSLHLFKKKGTKGVRPSEACEDAVTTDGEDKWSGGVSRVLNSVVFVVLLAIAALRSTDAEFARVGFKIEVIHDKAWVLLYEIAEFIWKKGWEIEAGVKWYYHCLQMHYYCSSYILW